MRNHLQKEKQKPPSHPIVKKSLFLTTSKSLQYHCHDFISGFREGDRHICAWLAIMHPSLHVLSSHIGNTGEHPGSQTGTDST